MRRTSLTLLTILILSTMVVFAQNGIPKKPIVPGGTAKEFSIQDDNRSGYIFINTVTGEYKVVFCEYDYAFSGIGKVEVLGCTVYFSDIQDGYRMFATANMCRQLAKVSCEVFERPDMPKIDPIQEVWVDTNLKDNTDQCWKSPK